MKLHVLSDLHIESGGIWIPPTDADVVVMAGDIGVGKEGMEWADIRLKDKPVVYVAGNHEFYDGDIDKTLLALAEHSAQGHIRFLENQSTEINGWTFLGCTLWTDFALGGDPAEAMNKIKHKMADFDRIKKSAQAFTPEDSVAIHQKSLAWLKDSLGRSNPSRTVVVTHHAPCRESNPPYHKGSHLSPTFVNALNQVVADSGVPLWIHGHTHHCVDYKVGKTRVLSNQAGYARSPIEAFQPGLVVEL